MMIFKIYIGLIAFIITSLLSPTLASTKSELKSSLYFSENPIVFDPPIIKKKETVFIPIRPLVNYFDGTIIKSKKDYSYTVSINNTQFKIKENVAHFTRNKTKYKFKNKPFKYKTRLYVPLHEFLLTLGFSIQEKNNHFYALSEQLSSPKPPPPPKMYLDYSHKPLKYSIKKLYLPISKKTLPLDLRKYSGKQYANLSNFLNFLGYSISIFENTILLKKSGTIYSFKNGSSVVKISENNQIQTKHVNYTPRIIGGRFYVELQPFLNDLGFDYLIQENQLVILKKLHSIELNDDQTVVFEKNSRIKMSSGTILNSPNRIFWDLPYTKCPSYSPKLSNDTINKVVFGQNKTTCRMVFYLSQSLGATVSNLSPTKQLISLSKYKKSYSQPKPIAKTPAKKSTKSLRGKVIIIDPGHGGSDPGAVTKNNDYEKYYTLDISKKLKNELQKQGAKVILLRTKDTNPSLYQRVRKINQLKGDFLVSVHVNSFINSKANGTETYYYKPSEKMAARKIQNRLVKSLKLRNNGIKHARMYILKHSKIPGVLIEPCFMTNSKEYSLLKQKGFRHKIASATAAGISDYFKSK